MGKLFVCIIIITWTVACNINTNSRETTAGDTAAIEKDQTLIFPDTIRGEAPPLKEENMLITCNSVGAVQLSDDYEAVKQKAGTENITIDSNYVEGMFQGIYTTLWKGSPEELKIFWADASDKRKIAAIEIENKKSVYRFASGIKIGTSLDELVKLNDDKPIRFYGFGWDYGGHIINFGNGRLQKDHPCFSGQLDVNGNIDGKFMGDKEINSSMPRLPLEKIYLSAIQIHAEHND